MPLLNWEYGIFPEAGRSVDHVITVAGWTHAVRQCMYWIVRISWWEYWS